MLSKFMINDLYWVFLQGWIILKQNYDFYWAIKALDSLFYE